MRLTPEEWVRQQFLHRLVDAYHYPAGRIGVEVAIAVGDAKKRCDAVVYDEQLQPLVLIECKAEHVALTQSTLDQALTYNRQLRVPYLFLHNGQETIVVHLDEGLRMKDERLNSSVDEEARIKDKRLNSADSETSETNVISPSSCVLHPSSNRSFPTISAALSAAFADASPDDLIFIGGSNYVVGTALQSPLLSSTKTT